MRGFLMAFLPSQKSHRFRHCGCGVLLFFEIRKKLKPLKIIDFQGISAY